MIYVICGEDDFSKTEFLEKLRQEIGSPELLEANTTVMAGPGLRLRHLQEVCSAVPFLAERRLVVVEGLLEQFDAGRAGGRDGRSAGAKGALEEWQQAPATLAHIPPTTILVFLEGGLRRDNFLLREWATFAQLREFPLLGGVALERWIRQRIADRGATATPQAVRRLVELVGGNLWVLSNEIEKLALYAGGEAPIDDEAVGQLVAYAREANIFRAVDSILQGRSAVAMRSVLGLRQSGADVSYVLTMLARQLRLILLAQELQAQRVPGAEMRGRLGLAADFAVRQVENQARRHSYERVAAMYRRLLETDLAIKRGELGEDLALETLVAELCASSQGRERPLSRGVSR
ncbi:MAG: DNA polymerase III subunit delta [Chloroflexota bacterium]